MTLLEMTNRSYWFPTFAGMTIGRGNDTSLVRYYKEDRRSDVAIQSKASILKYLRYCHIRKTNRIIKLDCDILIHDGYKEAVGPSFEQRQQPVHGFLEMQADPVYL